MRRYFTIKTSALLLSTAIVLCAAMLLVHIYRPRSVDLNWLFYPSTNIDCFDKIEELKNTKYSDLEIERMLSAHLTNLTLNRVNVPCLYPVILRYGSDDLINIFRGRMMHNTEENIIDANYIEWLRPHIPSHILSKIIRFKGRRFRTYGSYRQELMNNLTKDEYNSYGRLIVYGDRSDPSDYSSDLYNLLSGRELRIEDKKTFISTYMKLNNTISRKYLLDMHLGGMSIGDQLSTLNDILSKENSLIHAIPSILEDINARYPDEYINFVRIHKNIPVEFTCVLSSNCP